MTRGAAANRAPRPFLLLTKENKVWQAFSRTCCEGGQGSQPSLPQGKGCHHPPRQQVRNQNISRTASRRARALNLSQICLPAFPDSMAPLSQPRGHAISCLDVGNSYFPVCSAPPGCPPICSPHGQSDLLKPKLILSPSCLNHSKIRGPNSSAGLARLCSTWGAGRWASLGPDAA